MLMPTVSNAVRQRLEEKHRQLDAAGDLLSTPLTTRPARGYAVPINLKFSLDRTTFSIAAISCGERRSNSS
jgi:hypothetical protein